MQDQNSNVSVAVPAKRSVRDIRLGERFGKWLIIEEGQRFLNGSRGLICRCDCGTVKTIRAISLANAESNSCGCSFNALVPGKRFGRLVVVAITASPGISRGRGVIVKCDCGVTKTIYAGALTRTSEPYRSCGCLVKDIQRERLTSHGMSFDPHYKIWSSMIARCTNPKERSYQWYGAKGIYVCESWLYSFQCFLRDMGLRPSSKHKLTMTEPLLGYNPSNCSWQLSTHQQREADRNSEYMIGMRFGRWVVIDAAASDDHGRRCLARCDCGIIRVVRKFSLTGKEQVSQSCGCLTADLARERSTKHGGVDRPEYSTWKSIKSRCFDESNLVFPYYGGRGITMYGPWKDSFEEFFSYVGSKPTPGHTMDRFPNQNGNYEPGNVRWATSFEQNRNLRSNVLITARGKTLCLMDWSIETGVSFTTLRNRIRAGWPIEDALSRPPRPGVSFKRQV